MGLNFFSRVLSLARVPELRRSEYLVRRVCSSSSDHFLRFIARLLCLISRVRVRVLVEKERIVEREMELSELRQVSLIWGGRGKSFLSFSFLFLSFSIIFK